MNSGHFKNVQKRKTKKSFEKGVIFQDSQHYALISHFKSEKTVTINFRKKADIFICCYCMTTVDNDFLVKISNKFYCEKCNYIASRKFNYDIHLNSMKHKNNVLTTKIDDSLVKISKIYNCEKCDKTFNDRAGLWRHNKKCNQIQNYPSSQDPSNKDNLIEYLIKENQEFKNLILELAKKDTTTTNSNNTNCNNTNTFNLNMFLNEKCKDAININEFVDNIKMQLSDLENFGIMGYVEGVSRILIKNLKDLDAYSRPIHCSDLKREVFYIKDNNEWTKESDDKPVLKNAIKQVANKNIKQIQVWKNEHPDCIDSESRKNDQYINIVMNSMSGGTTEEQQSNISQIVKNVSRAVAIEKKHIL
jgi:hypothetical protein